MIEASLFVDIWIKLSLKDDVWGSGTKSVSNWTTSLFSAFTSCKSMYVIAIELRKRKADRRSNICDINISINSFQFKVFYRRVYPRLTAYRDLFFITILSINVQTVDLSQFHVKIRIHTYTIVAYLILFQWRYKIFLLKLRISIWIFTVTSLSWTCNRIKCSCHLTNYIKRKVIRSL